MNPRPYQIEGIEFLKARTYAMLGDEPGLGKTMQVILATDPMTSILVICPAQVKYHWKKEFKQWAGRPSMVVDKKVDLWGVQVTIINYDRLIQRKHLEKLVGRQWDYVICDEAHRLKNPKAKRTRAVFEYIKKKAKRMWFLTGTPIKNRPVDLYPVLANCARELIHPYDTYMKFAYRFCGAYNGIFGLVVSGATNMPELSQRLTPFLLRRLQKDHIKDLPTRVVQKIEFDCDARTQRLIEEEEERLAALASDSLTYSGLGEVSRLRQILALAKVDDACAFIEDRLEEVDKVVVFFHHHSVLHELVKKFSKIKTISISGKDSSIIREKKKDLFTTDKNVRILFGQMQALGEGVDGLQHVCRTCVFVEPSWSPTEVEQCIHRLERMGQKEVVNAYILTIKDTQETKMLDTAEWKEKVYRTIYAQSELKSKPVKENTMSIEQNIEEIKNDVKAVKGVLSDLITLLQNNQNTKDGGDDAVQTGAPEKQAVKENPKAARKTKEVKPAPAEDNRTVDECRELVVKAFKMKGGEAACKKIITDAGAEKLALATPEQLNVIYVGLVQFTGNQNQSVAPEDV